MRGRWEAGRRGCGDAGRLGGGDAGRLGRGEGILNSEIGMRNSEKRKGRS